MGSDAAVTGERPRAVNGFRNSLESQESVRKTSAATKFSIGQIMLRVASPLASCMISRKISNYCKTEQINTGNQNDTIRACLIERPLDTTHQYCHQITGVQE
jgi:hypothetical protein